jgi:hypothetical protein
MKNVAAIIAGIAASAVFILGVGRLAVQAMGLTVGAVFGLSGELVGVTPPGPAFLPLLGIAVLSALVLALVTAIAAPRSHRVKQLFRASFVATTIVLVVIGLMLLATGSGYSTSRLQQGVMPGWDVWLSEGGSASVVHLMLIVVIGVMWVDRWRPPVTGVTPSEVHASL